MQMAYTLNIKCKIIKLLENNIEDNLGGLVLGYGDGWPIGYNTWFMKEKTDKPNIIKMKNLRFAKDTVEHQKISHI